MKQSCKVPVESFVAQCREQMIPLSRSFSYFSALPLEESTLKELLYDPIAAVPPRVGDVLPNLRLVLVPYLEKGETRSGQANDATAAKSSGQKAKVNCAVAYKAPTGARRLSSAASEVEGQLFLFLAVKFEDLAEYHYGFFNGLAGLLTGRLGSEQRKKFQDLLRDELVQETHGEIDEKSWRLKERIVQRQMDPHGDSKSLQTYFRQAMVDTLTLYLHGLCCDIDLEASPRQLASRYIRRRLLLLRELLPPPNGFALFPEDL